VRLLLSYMVYCVVERESGCHLLWRKERRRGIAMQQDLRATPSLTPRNRLDRYTYTCYDGHRAHPQQQLRPSLSFSVSLAFLCLREIALLIFLSLFFVM